MNKREKESAKYKKYLIPVLIGAGYGMILIALTYGLFRNVGRLFQAIGKMVGMDQKTVEHIRTILSQFRDAEITLPFLFLILGGICVAVVLESFIKSRKRKVFVMICIGVFMLLAALCFTEINGIRIAQFAMKTTEKVEIRTKDYEMSGDSWYAGFGRRQILPDENSDEPFYIAGYKNGVEITDVLDYCEARAVWLDTGSDGVLLIGIDCVALDSYTVEEIRGALKDIPNCAAVNVYATHTHAGIDTLGMWGPIGVDGKNDTYMEALKSAAVEAGWEAYENRTKGELYYGYIKTEEMYRDSRDPQVYDENLYQLRFQADNGTDNIRFFFYGAHPESLRGNNTLLSRDYAGALCYGVAEATGDHTIFAPGAVGGLIMTKEFVGANTEIGAIINLKLTADKLIDYALSITADREEKLTPTLSLNSSSCVVPMDNIAFWLYRFLGILNHKAVKIDSATGYGVETEVSLLRLGEAAIALIPGEIFPELVYGGAYGDANAQDENPKSLTQIAAENEVENLLVIGLANDEIGYIVPPSDFLVNEEMPYLERVVDHKGEDHYEETNSIGPECANVIAETFEKLLR